MVHSQQVIEDNPKTHIRIIGTWTRRRSCVSFQFFSPSYPYVCPSYFSSTFDCTILAHTILSPNASSILSHLFSTPDNSSSNYPPIRQMPFSPHWNEVKGWERANLRCYWRRILIRRVFTCSLLAIVPLADNVLQGLNQTFSSSLAHVTQVGTTKSISRS